MLDFVVQKYIQAFEDAKEIVGLKKQTRTKEVNEATNIVNRTDRFVVRVHKRLP